MTTKTEKPPTMEDNLLDMNLEGQEDYWTECYLASTQGFRRARTGIMVVTGLLTAAMMLMIGLAYATLLATAIERGESWTYWRLTIFGVLTILAIFLGWWRAMNPLSKAINIVTALILAVTLVFDIIVVLWNGVVYSSKDELWSNTIPPGMIGTRDSVFLMTFWTMVAITILILVLLVLVIIIIQLRNKWYATAEAYARRHLDAFKGNANGTIIPRSEPSDVSDRRSLIPPQPIKAEPSSLALSINAGASFGKGLVERNNNNNNNVSGYNV